MAGTLHIQALVVTEEVLRERHGGEDEVCVAKTAVVTPTGWDFLRAHRLRLTRVQPAALETSVPAPKAAAPAGGSIPEVLPPGTEGGVLARGRCDHPDRAYGCKTEEFGSGFVQPSGCTECAVQRVAAAGSGGCGCGGCSHAGTDDASERELEALVQRITDQIMARLQGN